MGISERITAIYARPGVILLPCLHRFIFASVCVVFVEVPADSIYVGGKPAQQYVRIVSQHLARTMPSVTDKARAITAIEQALAPDVKNKGINWEIHIEEHDRDAWRCGGIVPPMPGSDAEKLWVRENAPVPYYSASFL